MSGKLTLILSVVLVCGGGLAFKLYADEKRTERCMQGYLSMDGAMNEKRQQVCKQPAFAECVTSLMSSENVISARQMTSCNSLQQ